MATVEERLAALEALFPEGEIYSSVHTGEQIDSAVSSVRQKEAAWSGKAEKPLVIPVTLSKDDWNETTKKQVISDENLIASSAYRYYFGSLSDSKAAYSEAGIDAEDIVTDGQITFTYEAKPEVDLNVEIHRLEVQHEQQP